MNREISVVNQLRKNIEKQFGKDIQTATDCDNLVSLITRDCKTNISSQTLRRFFGLIKTTTRSSHFTLDLLSQFCGYGNFKEFRNACNNQELELFFGNSDNTNHNYWDRSEQLCQQIIKSPDLLVSTHHRLMSFPMARKYFMENHPLRDLLGSVYVQYFSAYLKYNTSNEAKIFAYGFLFQSSFLLQNTESMDLYYNKVKETELTENVHVIPAGLKFGVQLLYADFTGNENLFKRYFAEMKKARLRYRTASEKSVCSFESTVLESLIFTNRSQEMKFLIENNTFQVNNDEDYIPSKRKETHDEVWKILCAVAYQKMRDKKNTERFLNQINLKNLGTGWKKYYSLLYYSVYFHSAQQDQKIECFSKLKILIGETYFCYYQNYLIEFSKELEPFVVGDINLQA
ncbi:hypothetical protein SAMN05421796_10420 [Chryseobacterium piscicola]|uniref:Uncharacterized protein n=1 Tax=Chryseobacterium piscicola TaxID=551459 RepID=A0A1N7M742_9FLAO|nr:hypothetical protein [Chryseobacterium piscicola]PQA98231.1 hypothetical protein B0A70_01225 [Chryseobacterium piscicola]SIS81819.1 hypothetical protein SAMN05421796_10420 [Chryseobacterium piscicola]